MKSFVRCEIKNRIAVITITNPPINALSAAVTRQLSDMLDKLKQNRDVRVLILTATGKTFVAGADIEVFKHLDRKSGEEYALAVDDMQRKLEEFEWPVIAAINGHALGGGCELAMCCDIRIASRKARFGQPEVTLGVIPGAGGTQRLPRLIPLGKAKIMLFTGQHITAAEAERMGLVDCVVEPGSELKEATTIATGILKNAPLAIKFIKKAVNRGLQMSLSDALMVESTLFGELFETEDVTEGVDAFFNKRTADFKGK
jgi:enoyl-CoA hydratase